MVASAPPARSHDLGTQGGAVHCPRCRKLLGIRAPGRFWSRHAGRMILLEGQRVTIWCERCAKETSLDLAAERNLRTRFS